MLATYLADWLMAFHGRQLARHRALEHAAVVARALYTGSTMHYTLTPDLPRAEDSTRVEW